MPRKLPKKVKSAPKKLRKAGSKARYRTSQTLFQRAPVKKDQELKVVIGDIGSEGDGIAIIQGYRVFVPGAKIGERVRIRIVSVGDRFAVAKILTPAR